VSRTDAERRGELRDQVVRLYRANRRQGHAEWRGADYDYTCPSAETYPFQWFWDSCFHAIVLSRLDPPRAEAEIATLLLAQRDDGFIPHMVRWADDPRDSDPDAPYRIAGEQPRLSSSMQPPILAEAVAAVAEHGRGTAFLREVMPAVRRYYDWCLRDRDGHGDGLITIFDPHESGMDQTPAYDALLGIEGDDPAAFEAAWRRIGQSNEALGQDPARIVERDVFVVADVAVNVLYAENQLVMSRLLSVSGDHDAAGALEERGRRTVASLFDRCWSNGDQDFHALAGQAQHMLPAGTLAGLLPILLEDLPADRADRIARRLEDPADYGTAFPAPSVSVANPAYRAAPAGGTVLWRGPTWINTNWYIARGLRRHGRDDLADRIAASSLALIERSGFREHYDARTSQGYGARDFAWSALALEMARD